MQSGVMLLLCRVYVNLETKEKMYTSGEHMCPADGWVCFRNSQLLCGRLGKATLGGGNKAGLYQVVPSMCTCSGFVHCVLFVNSSAAVYGSVTKGCQAGLYQLHKCTIMQRLCVLYRRLNEAVAHQHLLSTCGSSAWYGRAMHLC